MSLPLPPRDLGEFQITLPPELYLVIAEKLGQELTETSPADNSHASRPHWASLPPGFPPAWTMLQDDERENDSDDDGDEDGAIIKVREVTGHIKQMYPTLAMLEASTVNRYYRDKILLIALRWDAQSENPRAIYHAAVNNHVTLLSHALSQKNAEPDHVPHGLALPLFTPMMVAAAKGYLDVVDLLLKKGADAAHEFEASGMRTWQAAGLFSQSYDTMLDRPEDIAAVDHVTAVHCAMSAPQNAMAITEKILAKVPDEFFDKVADPDAKILAFAVAADLVDLIELLLHHNADFDHGGLTEHSLPIPVLHHAVSGRMVDKLLQCGARLQTPLAVGLNALHAVCLRPTDCHTAIEELVHRGIAVNDGTAGGAQRGILINSHPRLFSRIPQTALNFACRHVNLPHIRTLLNLGANPLGLAVTTTQCQDRGNGEFYQVTPFHDLFLPDNLLHSPIVGNGAALRESLYGAVQELLAHPLGRQALSLKQNVCFGSLEAGSKMKQEYWADRSILDVEEYGEFTPFQLFFLQPLVDDDRIPAAMLRACDQDIREQINTITEPYGVTPLLALLSHRFDHGVGEQIFYRPKLVEWLLENGADPNIPDREGFTPLHYAVFWLDHEAVDLLLAFDARIENRPKTLPTPLEIALGRVYKDSHMDHDLEESIWKRMVKLAGFDTGDWSPDMTGIYSCVQRWAPGAWLPTCALPGFDDQFKQILRWDHETDEERCGVSLHQELRDKGVTTVMQEQGAHRRTHIFEALVNAKGTLPLARPRELGYVDGVKAYKYSVLDWAVATGQHDHLLERLLHLGGTALSGHHCPCFDYNTMTWNQVHENWTRFKTVTLNELLF